MKPIYLGTIGDLSSAIEADNKTMRQTLLDLLKAGYVTPLDALQRAGCMSLSQRCGEFARDGHKVDKRWMKLANGKKIMSYKVIAE